jgi:hypothetical protein
MIGGATYIVTTIAMPGVIRHTGAMAKLRCGRLDSRNKLMGETMAVGRAAGVDRPLDFPAELDRWVAAFPPMMKASMANDLDAGNRLELDWLADEILRKASAYFAQAELDRRVKP